MTTQFDTATPAAHGRYLTVDDMCARGNFSKATMYRRIKNGNGPRAFRSGKLLRVHPEDFDRWMRGGQAV